MTTSTKLSGGALSPRPPAKGSFPLDHLAECKPFAVAYERCLSENHKLTNKCRKEAREYLQCRMERGLMAKEEWEKLGLSKVDDNGGEKSMAKHGDAERSGAGNSGPECSSQNEDKSSVDKSR